MIPTEFAADLARTGHGGPAELRLGPGERRTPHTHPFAVRGLVTRGTLILAREGREDRHEVGDTFELAREAEHFEAAGAEGATYLVGRRE